MPRRLLKIVSGNLSQEPEPHPPTYHFAAEDIVWVMGSFCALNRKPFDAGLLIKQFPPPYSSDSFIHAARALGFRIRRRDSATISGFNFPCLVVLDNPSDPAPPPLQGEGWGVDGANKAESDPASSRKHRPAIVVKVQDDGVILFEAGANTPITLTHAEFAERFTGAAFWLAPEAPDLKDPDGALHDQKAFGFRWFVPELLKHKRVWRDVLIASLIIQLLALGTLLFTQVIIKISGRKSNNLF